MPFTRMNWPKGSGEGGTPGKDGKNGATFTPHVSTEGVLSWTNDQGLPNPEPVNIKGPAGEGGESVIAWKPIVEADGTITWTRTASTTKPAEQNIKGEKGDDGAKGDTGEAGFSPTVMITDISGGHRVTITDASSEHSFDVMDGESGSGGDKVFVAVYGVTTAQEIIAFLDSGSPMPFFVERAGSYYTVTTASKQSDKRVIIRSFATMSGNYYMFVYDITNDRWGSSNSGFQPLLESGLNIKTVNGESLLGGGNIIVKGDGSNDYETLDNKPIIEGVTVTGSKSADEYNLASKTYVDTNIGNIEVLLQTI